MRSDHADHKASDDANAPACLLGWIVIVGMVGRADMGNAMAAAAAAGPCDRQKRVRSRCYVARKPPWLAVNAAGVEAGGAVVVQASLGGDQVLETLQGWDQSGCWACHNSSQRCILAPTTVGGQHDVLCARLERRKGRSWQASARSGRQRGVVTQTREVAAAW
nr:hypothetical protein CFP56_11686 [Quercus suber]